MTRFRSRSSSLVERHARVRERSLTPVTLPDGQTVLLSPGGHNELLRAIIQDFAPRFAPGSRLVYLGDAANKGLFVDEVRLEELRIPITDHGKLPDVVLFDAKREWLFLVEAVTSHGPVSPTRMVDLETMLSECRAGAVYVSAFPSFEEFRTHVRNIAWETEVWL